MRHPVHTTYDIYYSSIQVFYWDLNAAIHVTLDNLDLIHSRPCENVQEMIKLNHTTIYVCDLIKELGTVCIQPWFDQESCEETIQLFIT